MILWIAKYIAGWFGIDTTKAQRIVVVSLLVIGVLMVGFIALQVKSCFHKKPSIDLDTVNRINTANESQRKKELEKVIFENQEVIKTVDERTNLADVNIVEREKAIDEKIKQVDAKIQEAKANGKDVTSAELECILTGNC